MRSAAKLNKGEGVVRLLLPPDEQLREAFPTFTESGGHFSVPVAAAGTTVASQAATAPRTGDLRTRFICFSLRPILPRFEGPYRRRRPGGQGASHDVPGVIWS